MRSCPDPAALEDFLRGRLPDRLLAELTAHVEECSACQLTLDILSREEPLPDGRPVISDEPVLPPFLSSLANRPPVPKEIASHAPPNWPVLEDYEILGELGDGGMGIVYKARHLRLNRIVALKMLHGGMHRLENLREQLRHEARTLARLEHPNIVRVYDIVEHGGHPFFSLEFVEGTTLARLIGGKPLPPAQAAELLATTAMAVDYAHRNGILHRDLKPANILLEEISPARIDSPQVSLIERWSPKIADFGLAKVFSQTDTLPGPISESGSPMGTPAYMAPEQADFSADHIGPATDIYSLGAILYELLAGHAPFAADSTLRTMMKTLHEDPPPLAGIPRDLATVCMKCLEKKPENRYARASDLADDLRRFLTGEPVAARPLGLGGRFMKWARRRPAVTAVYGLAAFVLILMTTAGVAVALWQQARQDAEQILLREARLQQQAGNGGEDHECLEQIACLHNVGLAALEKLNGNFLRAARLLDECAPEWRGWEWHHADRLIHEEIHSGLCRRSPVDAVFLPDGRGVRMANPSGDLTRFGFDDRRTATLPAPQTSGLNLVRLSADGRRMAVASSLKREGPWRVEIRDADTGRRLADWDGGKQDIRFLTISDDGERVAAAFGDGQLFGYEISSAQPRHVSAQPAAPSQRPRFLGATFWLLVDSGEDYVIIDAGSGKIERRFTTPDSARAAATAGTQDGRVLIIATITGILHVHERPTGRILEKIKAHMGEVTAMAVSPDGKTVVTGGEDGAVRRWDSASMRTFHGHRGRILGLNFNRAGDQLVSSDDSGNWRVWSMNKPSSPVTTMNIPPDPAGMVTVSPDLGRAFVRESPKGGMLWNIAKRERAFVQGPKNQAVTASAFHPNGRMFALGAPNGDVELWDMLEKGPVSLGSLKGNQQEMSDSAITSLQFSADGRRVLVASTLRLSVWETTTRSRVFDHAGAEHVALSPDGRRVAFGSSQMVWVVDLTHSAKHELIVPPKITALGFTPDSQALMAGTKTWSVLRYPLSQTGEPHTTPDMRFVGHTNVVRSLAFGPDGRRLATGAEDGAVKLWDTRTGQEAIGLEPKQSKPILRLQFTPDGHRLAATPQGQSPVIFDGAPREEPIVEIGK
ncbi:WD40 repeat domain-containing serine/threonine-protein kinase [Zavarzinella formosa]|uniref:WD40 repeat domain-containing serine/threonine-protein kinase n=1 Tax=Zavarzinella formosa TaxID=360055 RepID=UPI00030F0CA9|nr:WD40 repeat domain-containing serine/threonine-protein kinase [Zavarzinella formosa]